MRFAEAKSIGFFCSLGALSIFLFSACTTSSGLLTSTATQRTSAGGAAGSAAARPAAADPVPDSADSPEGETAAEASPPAENAPGPQPAEGAARPPAVLASLGSPVSGTAESAAQPGDSPPAPTEPPATIDLVAVERPAVAQPPASSAAKPPASIQAKPPVRLEAVPRTSVENRPTNQIMMVRTTAYSHLEADSLPYGNKSAAGTPLKYGSRVRSAAADWSKYPLGTRFMIEGLPYVYEVDDYGSALAGTETLDIYKPNLAGIRQWGARNVPVRVLEWGSFEESRRILDSRKHVRHAHHVRQMLSEIERKAREGKLDERPAGLSPAPGGGA